MPSPSSILSGILCPRCGTASLALQGSVVRCGYKAISVRTVGWSSEGTIGLSAQMGGGDVVEQEQVVEGCGFEQDIK